jgi:hypothetical protein
VSTGGTLLSAGTFVPPDIVQNGLIAHLDPSNLNSYTGSGATMYNLVDGSTIGTLGGTYNTTTGGIRLTNSSSVGGSNVSRLQLNTLSNITTVSLWYYQHSTGGTSRILIDGRVGAAGGLIANSEIGSNWTSGTLYKNGGASSSITWAAIETIGSWQNITVIANSPITDDLGIFTRTTGDFGLDVTFGPILVYNRAITQEENVSNFNAIRARYNLAGGSTSNTIERPIVYSSGGYNNGSYVALSSTNNRTLTSSTTATVDISTGGGLTISTLARVKSRSEVTAATDGVYPPAAMTANTTTISDQSYGNGLYTASASSATVSSAFNAFDKNTAEFNCAGGRYGDDGIYLGNNEKFPPTTMTGDTTTFSGLASANGTYTVVVSSTAEASAGYRAMDGNTSGSSFWGSATGVYATSGSYIGNAGIYANFGEWIQLNTFRFSPKSLTITCLDPSCAPGTFLVYHSTGIHTTLTATNWSISPTQTFSVPLISGTGGRNNWGIVVTSVAGTGGSLKIDNMFFTQRDPVSTTDSVGTVHKGETIILEIPTGIYLKSFSVARGSSNPPSTFALVGSNNGNTWDLLYNTSLPQSLTSDINGTEFITNASTSYTTFTLIVKSIIGSNNYSIRELSFTQAGAPRPPLTIFDASDITGAQRIHFGQAATFIHPLDYVSSSGIVPLVITETNGQSFTTTVGTPKFKWDSSQVSQTLAKTSIILYNNSEPSVFGDNTTMLTYQFVVPTSTTYKINIQGLFPNVNNDSFWISLDGSTAAMIPPSAISIRNYQLFTAYSSVTLSAGTHTIVIQARETGALGGIVVQSTDEKYFGYSVKNEHLFAAVHNGDSVYPRISSLSLNDITLDKFARYTLTYNDRTGDVKTYVNNDLVQSDTAIAVYPPQAMTANTTTISGALYGNGGYVAAASSETTGALVFNVFDKNLTSTTANFWISADNLYGATTGSYLGSISTTVGSTVYSGEWLQLQIPVGIKLSKTILTPIQETPWNTRRSPRDFIIAGSNNGNIWDSLLTVTGEDNWTTASRTYTVNSNTAYTYFRVIGLVIGNSIATDRTRFSLQGVEFYGTEQITSKTLTRVSIGRSLLNGGTNSDLDIADLKVYNRELTQRELRTLSQVATKPRQIATAAITELRGEETPAIALDANSLSLDDGSKVADWNGYIQSSDSRRPIYRSSSGYNGGSYVEFRKGAKQFLTGPGETLRVSANGGLTIAGIARFPSDATNEERIIELNSSGYGTGVGNLVMARSGTDRNLKITSLNIPSTSDATSAVSSWNRPTSNVTIEWIGITWSPELSLFVAVGHSGTGNRVMTSSDGVTWTSRASADDTCRWWDVCWSPQLSLFVAVAYEGTSKIMTSPDGITWTARSSNENALRGVCWSAELSLFVAVGDSGTGNRVQTSPDGINWTSQVSVADNPWFKVCWSAEKSLFVAVGGNFQSPWSTVCIMTSPNGINWTSVNSSDTNLAAWRGVVWSKELSLFVAVAYRVSSGNKVITSSDGINWTRQTPSANNDWRTVAWSPELGLFVAVSENGTNRVMTSPDGINWTARSNVQVDHYGVTWSPQLGIFAAVSQTSTASRVMTSTPTKLGIETATERNAVYKNEWVPFAARYSSTDASLQIYKGTSINTTSAATATLTDRDFTTALLGKSSGEIYSNLDLAGLWVWDRALSDRELAKLYNSLVKGASPIPQPTKIESSLNSTLDLESAVVSVDLKSPVVGGRETPREYPPDNKINGAVTQVSGSDYGNGMYICSASSVASNDASRIAANAFESTTIVSNVDTYWTSEFTYNSTTGSYIGEVTTIAQNGTSYSGEWLQINLPEQIILNSYSILPRQDGGTGVSRWARLSPSAFVILGSNDGVSWNLVNSQSGISNWTSAVKIFTIPNNYVGYCFYRMVVSVVGNLDAGPSKAIVNISRWRLFGSPQSTSTNALLYPPAPLTANTTTISSTSTSYASGVYTASASSTTFGSFYPFSDYRSGTYTFTDSFDTDTSANYLLNTFIYSGSATTGSASGFTWDTANGKIIGNSSNNNMGLRVNQKLFPELLSNIQAIDITLDYLGGTTDNDSTGIMIVETSGKAWLFVIQGIPDFPRVFTYNSLSVGASSTPIFTGTSTYNIRTAHILRVVYSENNLQFYVDGSLQGSYVPSSKLMIETFGIASLSLSPGGSYGSLSAIVTYNNRHWESSNSFNTTTGGFANAGVTWTSRAPIDDAWSSVCWSPELSIFVAIAYNSAKIATSSDGITWTTTSPLPSQQWLRVVWVSELGLFIASSQSGTNRIATSSDGITWTERSCPSGGWYEICWSPELRLLVAVSQSGSTNNIMTSPDGISWTARSSPTAVSGWRHIAWSPELSLFVAVTSSGSETMRSSDGINWITGSLPSAGGGPIEWSSELGIFVMNKSGGNVTSTNGINWTETTISGMNAARDIIWVKELSTFVMVTSLTGTRIRTSPDGVNWTSRTAAANLEWWGVTYSPQLNLFVAVSQTGTGNRIMTSGGLGSESGEFLQLQLPRAITPSSFTILPRQDTTIATQDSPRYFLILGSNNGTSYDLLYKGEDVSWSTAAQEFFITNTKSSRYNYLRLLVTRVGNASVSSSKSCLQIAGVTFKETISTSSSSEISSQISISDLIQNDSTKVPLQISNSTILEFPPQELTSNTSAILSADYANGTYTVSASTELNSSFLANRAFNSDLFQNIDGYWYSATANTVYNATTGSYTGTTGTTVVDSKTYSGEWLQIELPQEIKLQSFAITPRNGNSYRSPNTFVILGSNDGVSWNLIDSRSAIDNWTINSKTFNVSNSAKYKYFRMVVSSVGNSNQTTFRDAVNIARWQLYGTISEENYLSFNSSKQQHLTIPSTPLAINTNGGFTALARVRFTGSPAINEPIFDFGSQIEMFRSGTTGNLALSLLNGTSGSTVTAGNALVQGEFVTLAARYRKSDNRVELFKNGVRIAQGTNSVTLTDRTTTGFVARPTNANDSYSNIDLSSLYLFDRALSDTELTSLHDIASGNTSSLTPTDNFTPVNSSKVVLVPPATSQTITADTFTITDATYGNGTFVVTRSGIASTQRNSYQLFNYSDPDLNNFWGTPNGSFNASTGFQTRNLDPTGTGYLGEWLKIQLPYRLRVSSYMLAGSSSFNVNRTPRAFAIFGSIDNMSWTKLDEQNLVSNPSRTELLFDVRNTTSFRYFMYVINRNWGEIFTQTDTLKFYGIIDPTTTEPSITTRYLKLTKPSSTPQLESPRIEVLDTVDTDVAANKAVVSNNSLKSFVSPNIASPLASRSYTPVQNGLIAWFDPNDPLSYSGSGATLGSLIGTGISGTIGGTSSFANGTIRLVNNSIDTTSNVSSLQLNTLTNITTVSLWYYQHSPARTDGTSRGYILDGRSGGAGGWLYYGGGQGSNWTTGTLYKNGGSEQSMNLLGSLTVENGKWQNITVIANSALTDDLTIFARNNQGTQSSVPNSQGLDVTFGPILIYNRAITQAENESNFNSILANYFSTPNPTLPITNGLIAWFDPSDTRCYSGTGSTLTSLIPTSLSGTGGTLITGTLSSTGTYTYNTDGTITLSDTHLQCDTLVNITTVSLWYYQPASVTGRYLLDMRTGGSGGFIYKPTAGVDVGSNWTTGTLYKNGGSAQAITWNNIETIGSWQNITVIANTSATDDITFFARNTQDGGRLDVTFGPILIYNRALTEAENRTNYELMNRRLLTQMSQRTQPAEFAHTAKRSLLYPPIALTADTTAISTSSTSYGSGTYNVRVSSTSVGAAYNALDGSSGSVWTSASGSYDTSTGAYSGTVTTADVLGNTYNGEYLQIKTPERLYLTGISIAPNTTSFATSAPASFALLGSRNGVDYEAIMNTTASFATSGSQLYSINGTTGTAAAFDNFRLLTTSIPSLTTELEYPPVAMTADTTNVTSASYGNGTYIATKSDGTQFSAYGAFNKVTNENVMLSGYDSTTGNYIGNVSTLDTISNTETLGGYVQLQLPKQITLSSFTYTPRYDSDRALQWVVFGSNDGTTWNKIFERTISTSSYTTNDVINGSTKYAYYRFVFTKKNVTETQVPSLNATEIRLFSRDNDGVASLSEVSLYGGTVNSSRALLSFPPAAMTANTTAILNTSYGAGTYIASASSTFTTNGSFLAFDNDISKFWHSNAGGNVYNETTGSYAGTTTMTAGNVGYAGEWLQIQTPSLITLDSISIVPRQDYDSNTQEFNYVRRSPNTFHVFGSRNGSTWELVKSFSNVNNWTTATKYFTIDSLRSFNYYRLLTTIVGQSGDRNSLQIAEWKLYGRETSSQIREFPPGALSADSATLAGYPYGEGSYNTSVSSLQNLQLTSIRVLGNDGGSSAADGVNGGAGGGGATQIGFNNNSGSGGNGGEGYACDITGTTVVYGSGGGGGRRDGTNGIGGTNAGNGGNPGTSGVNNTGGGGGAGESNAPASRDSGNGGSGIVVIRYNTTDLDSIIGSGGDSVTKSNNYQIHQFTTTGGSTFTVAQSGKCDILIVGGGGAGGKSDNYTPGGGGGGGKVIHLENYNLSTGTYSITVGAGGIGGALTPSNGDNSSFSTMIALGGGAGGVGNGQVSQNGGSGGGGSRNMIGATATAPSPSLVPNYTLVNTSTPSSGWVSSSMSSALGWRAFDDSIATSWRSSSLTSTKVLGNSGGSSIGSAPGGGGGGGATQIGFNNNSGSGGNGGEGYACDITGTTVVYGSGGGGGRRNTSVSNGVGGTNAGNGGAPGTAGTDGTGSGGGGGEVANPASGGNGGSGIVIVRYDTTLSDSIVGSGGTTTTSGNYRIHQFTSTGGSTFTVSQAGKCDLLIVGGGGAGGNNTDTFAAGGGGGGGKVIHLENYNLVIGSYAVSVGSGGVSSNGGNSSFDTIIALGGGKGGNGQQTGQNGGSGGGSGRLSGGVTGIGGAATAPSPSLVPGTTLTNTGTTAGWTSSNAYSTSGSYLGTTSMTAGNVGYAGEWLQLQTPSQIRPTSYTITPNSTLFASRSPSTFYLFGSTDNSVYTLLDTETSITWTSSPQSFIVNTASSFSYFRLLTTVVGNSGDRSTVEIAELSILGEEILPSSYTVVDLGADTNVASMKLVNDTTSTTASLMLLGSQMVMINTAGTETYTRALDSVKDVYQLLDTSIKPAYKSTNNALTQLFSGHDDSTIAFDALYDNSFRRSTSGITPFAIRKGENSFKLQMGTLSTSGSSMSFTDAISVNKTGNVSFGSGSSISRLLEGTTTVGTGTSGTNSFTITLPQTLGSSSYLTFVNPEVPSGTEVFFCTVTNKTTSSFVVNIIRSDSQSWSSNLILNWKVKVIM